MIGLGFQAGDVAIHFSLAFRAIIRAFFSLAFRGIVRRGGLPLKTYSEQRKETT
jgi:hypothetical protein